MFDKINAAPDFLRRSLLSKGTRFFVTPEPLGRRITAGFSFIQRVGKSASLDVWFPDALRSHLDAKQSAGFALSDDDFPAEWAAVRQFELLQEAGNSKIYDLKTDHLWRTMLDLSTSMRAGGYRVTIVTIGSYVDDHESDDLEILDQRLQDRLSALTHMLYLERESDGINAKNAERLLSGLWDYRTELPHIGVTLGARDIFRPIKVGAALSKADRRHKLAQKFFDIVAKLPKRHIVHDTAVGLQLPDANAENEAIYCAHGEDSLHGFSQAMSDIFAPFDRFSTGRLNGHEGAGAEIKSTTQHLRGYGDHMTEAGQNHLQRLACYTMQ